MQKEIFEEILVSHMPVGHTVSRAINYYFQWDKEYGEVVQLCHVLGKV